MAPKMSSARELAIASRKRPSSPNLFESDSLISESESPSDFETPNRPAKKPVKKKARTKSILTPLAKNEVVAKIPKEYQSNEENPLFGVKWYKEVTKREEFWADFQKKVPKGVFVKRFKVEVMIDLNEEGGKGGCGNEKTTVATGKAKKTTGAKKTLRKPAEGTPSTGLAADLDDTEDAPVASIEVPEDANGEVQSEDTITLSGDIKLDEAAAGPIQESTDTTYTAAKDGDDLITKALADPDLTPEKRAHYIAIQEEQMRTARVIELQVEENKRLEKARQKREEAKERKAAREANAEAEQEGDEEEANALNTDENGKKDKPRKIFNPTKF